MRIAAAVLADAAVVREGIITIVNAGINIFRVPQLPSQVGATAAFMIELDQEDRSASFDLRMVAYLDDDPSEIRGELTAEWLPADDHLESSLISALMPVTVNVAFPLQSVIVTTEGVHTLSVTINQEEVCKLKFLVMVADSPVEV